MSFQTDLYDELVEDIYSLTARPDLVAETTIALKTATINAHHSELYNRDHVDQLVQIPNQANNIALDIANLFPRFRQVDSIQLLDVNYNIVATNEGSQIEIVEIGDTLDPVYGTLKNNIAYVAGSTLNVRSIYGTYGYLVGWFQAPLVRREQYNSWIAQLYSPVILYWAASIVLGTNGNEEKSKNYMNQVEKVHLPQLKSNYLTGKAR